MSGDHSHFEHPFYRIVLPLILGAIPIYWGWQDHQQKSELILSADANKSSSSTSATTDVQKSEEHSIVNNTSKSELSRVTQSDSQFRNQHAHIPEIVSTQNKNIIKTNAPVKNTNISVEVKQDECSNPDVELRPLECMEKN